MFFLSLALFGIAALIGIGLALLHFRTEGVPAIAWPIPVFHGLLAVGGLTVLLFALQGPPRGAAMGTTPFGPIAAGLLVLAALAGARILYARVARKRRAEIAVGVHAMLAIAGFVFLIAYMFS
jgi:hypothetical protein